MLPVQENVVITRQMDPHYNFIRDVMDANTILNHDNHETPVLNNFPRFPNSGSPRHNHDGHYAPLTARIVPCLCSCCMAHPYWELHPERLCYSIYVSSVLRDFEIHRTNSYHQLRYLFHNYDTLHHRYAIRLMRDFNAWSAGYSTFSSSQTAVVALFNPAWNIELNQVIHESVAFSQIAVIEKVPVELVAIIIDYIEDLGLAWFNERIVQGFLSHRASRCVQHYKQVPQKKFFVRLP